MFCGENLQCLAAVEAAISMVFVIVEFPFIKCNVETSDRIVEEQVPLFHCVLLLSVFGSGYASDKPDIALFAPDSLWRKRYSVSAAISTSAISAGDVSAGKKRCNCSVGS